MDDDLFKEDDDDIHKVGVQNKDFHLVKKRLMNLRLIMIQILVTTAPDYQLI